MLGQVPWLQSALEKTGWPRGPGQLRTESIGKTSPSQSEMGQRAHEAEGHIAPPVYAVTKCHQPRTCKAACRPTAAAGPRQASVQPFGLRRPGTSWSSGDLVPTNDSETGKLFPSLRSVQCQGHLEQLLSLKVSLSSITCTAGRSASRWLRSPAAQGCRGTGPESRGWRRPPGAPQSSRPSPASQPPPPSCH